MEKLRTLERPPYTEDETTKPPLLVLLHGFGSNEQDLMGMAPYLDERLYIVSVRGIYDINGIGYGWFYLYGTPGNLTADSETKAHGLEVMQKFLPQLIERVGADPQRVYLLGFSQGCAMSLSLALTMPDTIAGVIAISGYLDQDVREQVQPDTLKHMHMLYMHGVADDVLPVHLGRAAREFLQTLPITLGYHEYPIGHSIHQDGFSLLRRWLSERLDAAEA